MIMNFQDTVKLLSMVQRLYPNQIKMADKDEFEFTAKLWEKILYDMDYQQCTEALITHTRLNYFAPQPSDIVEIVAKRNNPEVFKSGQIAWEEVCAAVRKFGFNRQSEAFVTLDEKTKRVTRAIGWWNICYDEKPQFVKKEFLALWDSIATTEQETIKIDPSKFLAEIGQHQALEDKSL